MRVLLKKYFLKFIVVKNTIFEKPNAVETIFNKHIWCFLCVVESIFKKRFSFVENIETHVVSLDNTQYM